MKILTLAVTNEGTPQEEVVYTHHDFAPAEALMYFQKLLLIAEQEQAKKELIEKLKQAGKLPEDFELGDGFKRGK